MSYAGKFGKEILGKSERWSIKDYICFNRERDENIRNTFDFDSILGEVKREVMSSFISRKPFSTAIVKEL